MLHEFIARNRDEIIRRCRAKVGLRSVPAPTLAEIDHGVPVFLDQLVDALRHGVTSGPEISEGMSQTGQARQLYFRRETRTVCAQMRAELALYLGER